MALRILVSLLFAAVVAITEVNGNFEGDVLNSWKVKLSDPNNILQSWDPTLVNPCTWYHVTCNSGNKVTRVDLGNAGLSGPLIPQLGLLAHLQYLEVYANKMYGTIPTEIGNLASLVSLDLYQNQLSGVIPSSIGNLINLRFLRLNSNNLSGKLPVGVINLVQYGNLMILNVTDNNLAGTVRSSNSTGAIVTTILQDPKSKKKMNGI